MEDIGRNIGKVIKERRAASGMTQAQIGELVGVDDRAWRRYEAQGINRLTTLDYVCKTLGWDIIEIVTAAKKMRNWS